MNNIFLSQHDHGTLGFAVDVATANLNGATYIRSTTTNHLGLLRPDLDIQVHFPESPESQLELILEAFGDMDSVPVELLPNEVIKFLAEPDEVKSEYTESGDPDYCIDCDIQSKLKGIILARLGTDQVIDSESANVLLKLYTMAYPR